MNNIQRIAGQEGVPEEEIEIIREWDEEREHEVIHHTEYRISKKGQDRILEAFCRQNPISDPRALAAFIQESNRLMNSQTTCGLALVAEARSAMQKALQMLKNQSIPITEPNQGSAFAETVLMASGIPFKLFWADTGVNRVFVTDAGQLIGSYATFRDHFRPSQSKYKGWHGHHLVEDRDWTLIGINVLPYQECPCVLLPAAAHSERINSILQGSHGESSNRNAAEFTVRDLINHYYEAYVKANVLGNYTGEGEEKLQTELMNLVLGILRVSGVLS